MDAIQDWAGVSRHDVRGQTIGCFQRATGAIESISQDSPRERQSPNTSLSGRFTRKAVLATRLISTANAKTV